MTATKVLAISGHAQNGKDTVAGMIDKKLSGDGYSVLVAHYADLLKHICRSCFEWNGLKDDAGRHLLQYVGTDVVRKKAPDFWVDFIISVLNLFEDAWDYVIIPDSRFPNEIAKLRTCGFDVTHIRVIRGGDFVSPLTPEQQQHASETALDDYPVDYAIHNDGSLNDLEGKVNNFVEEFVYD